MKALCWYGKNDVRVERVPDPKINDPRDATIKVTSTAICGSDLDAVTCLPEITLYDKTGLFDLQLVT